MLLAERECRACQTVRPIERFTFDRRDGSHQPRCKECINAEVRDRYRQRRQENPQEVRAALRAKHVRQAFRLDYLDYLRMIDDQDNRCAICNQPETSLDHRSGETRALAIDHDHRNGRVRQLLCRSCNLMLGHAQDTPGLLEAAAEYLRVHAPQMFLRGENDHREPVPGDQGITYKPA